MMGRARTVALTALIAAACTDSSGPEVGKEPERIPAPSIGAVALTPLVGVVGDAGQTITLEMPDVTADSVRVLVLDPVSIAADGRAGAWALYDDGTHGDALAADRVFTRSGLTPGGSGPARSATITAASFVIGSSETEFVPLKLSLRALDTLQVPPLDPATPAPDIQVTAHAVAVVTPAATAFEEMRAVGQRYLEAFPADRDFLIVQVGPRPSAASGFGAGVRAPPRGIGEPGFNPNLFPGAGSLMLAIVLYTDAWRDHGRPAGTFCLVTHEIAHSWAAFLGHGLASQGHWTATFVRSRSAFGVDGECVFNALELYLAGLVPADSVTGTLTSSGLTIADVVMSAGQRIPSWPATKRDFSAAFVVSSERPLSRVELAWFDFIAREYGQAQSALGLTFEGATGGRATLDTRIPPPR